MWQKILLSTNRLRAMGYLLSKPNFFGRMNGMVIMIMFLLCSILICNKKMKMLMLHGVAKNVMHQSLESTKKPIILLLTKKVKQFPKRLIKQ